METSTFHRTRPRAATLAVGTEITDGQIIDRNSAWISQKLVAAGVEVIEHRAVPDDRDSIAVALEELSHEVDLLFVTGGLGPTSDDFTRDLLASVFHRPLEYDEASWKKIEDHLKARGISAKEIQRQQCFYPQGSRILVNPVGTANAFSFESKVENERRLIRVYALPGPPVEIAAIWQTHLNDEIEALLPVDERDDLYLIRTIGRGESDIAEITEAAIAGSGLRVGYRAHLPYIEVKLWCRRGEKAQYKPVFDKVERELATWTVNHGLEDVTDGWVKALREGRGVLVQDALTKGVLQERVLTRLKDEKLLESEWPFEFNTCLRTKALQFEKDFAGAQLLLDATSPEATSWRMRVKSGTGEERTLEEALPFSYKIRSERARKFIAEKIMILLRDVIR